MENLIHTADWVLPISDPPVMNGAVVVANGRIAAVGPARQLLSQYNLPRAHHVNSIIVPAWVNAHCHLELSHLAGKRFTFANFVDWISQLVALRQKPVPVTDISSAARSQMQLMRKGGTALVGDITNGHLLGEAGNEVERVVFYEILGFRADQAEDIYRSARQKAAAARQKVTITPHALYSTSRQLMSLIYDPASVFSIHVAESPEESEFLQQGKGAFVDFLKVRNVWDPDWRPPGCSAIQALEKMGLLQENTLLVHCVQIDDRDIELISRAGASVCLCPRSNDFTRVGRAPLQTLLEKDIPLCLGTDSLLSNENLDLNDEIYYIYRNFAGIDPADILRLATLNGAKALRMAGDYGSIEAGKLARLNIFEFDRKIIMDPEMEVVARNWRRITCI